MGAGGSVRLRRICLGVVLTLVAAGAARAEVFEQILVKVNGEIFTKSDLEQRQVQALRQQDQNLDPNVDLSKLPDAQLRQRLDALTPQIVVDAVDEMLVVQRGKELGYRLGDEQFKDAIDSIKKNNNITSDEQFQAALKQEGLTLAELRKNFERTMIIQRVEQTEVFNKVAVTEDEARAYYQAHQAEFTTPASVTLREILLGAPADARGVNAAQDDELRAKAEAVRARVEGGESFEQVARDVSDSPSKANGGVIGPLNISDLSTDLQKLIATMKVGDVTEPLRTPRGYQILKLDARTEAVTMPFDQARERISNEVFTDKRRAEFRTYLDKLRAQALIEWKNNDIEKAYDEGLKSGVEGNL
jgi:peptidyl-prolyl cis-trans isomerase SurA